MTKRIDGDFDSALVEALSRLPTTPALVAIVLGRVARRQRFVRFVGVTAVVTLLTAVGIVGSLWSDRRPSEVVSKPAATLPATNLDDYCGVIQAASNQPVQPLQGLERQKDAWVAALLDLDKEQ